MARPERLENEVRSRRARLGWTQHDLAARSGLSRTGIGAIESGRLVPSTLAALALASALGCRVEDLFRLPGADPGREPWAWPGMTSGSGSGPTRFWRAEVGGTVRRYPVEPLDGAWIAEDGRADPGGSTEIRGEADPSRTLVVATCDPAVAVLGAELFRSSGIRLLAFGRSSAAALELLEAGVVHAAGVHLGSDGGGEGEGNAASARSVVGSALPLALVRLARWDEGIASSPSARVGSSRDALHPRRRWVGREAGSGARRVLDHLFEGRKPPTRLASEHRGVARAIRDGWAEVGVCHRLAAEERGLDFLPVRRADHDLCYRRLDESTPLLRALLEAIRSPAYRRTIAGLPGFDTTETGSTRPIG